MPTHSCIQWVPEAVPLRVKELEHEPDHLVPCIANFMNVWWYNTLTPYILNEWFLVKDRDVLIMPAPVVVSG